MFKVQSPKSITEEPQTPFVGAQVDSADVGHLTLDIGLRVSDLRKSFLSPNGDRIEVIRGTSFSAAAGEAVAVVGASGAGKSTLLHLLGGLEPVDHGKIVAGQFAVDRAGPAALARFRNKHVGFIFQFHHLLPDLTAAENVSLPLRVDRIGAREAMRRAFEMLETVGLDRRVSTSLVGHLSGGEQQRVAVCRALINRPGLVLADEPTGNLDAATGDTIARLIVAYARERRALVVIATHSQSLAASCNRVLYLQDGRLRETPV